MFRHELKSHKNNRHFTLHFTCSLLIGLHTRDILFYEGYGLKPPEGKRPLGRPRRRWEDNIKMDLQEVGGGCGDWM